MFHLGISFRKSISEAEIRRLQAEGLSLTAIADQIGSTIAFVRRVLGKVDKEGVRRRQEVIARQIDAEPLPWSEKVARWRAQTGQSGTTFWRVLKRCGGLSRCTSPGE
jgi:hypothetical protein